MKPRYEPAHTRYPIWPWVIALLAVAGTVYGFAMMIDAAMRLGL